MLFFSFKIDLSFLRNVSIKLSLITITCKGKILFFKAWVISKYQERCIYNYISVVSSISKAKKIQHDIIKIIKLGGKNMYFRFIKCEVHREVIILYSFQINIFS